MNRLLKVQNELKAPKGNYNKFGNYKYRSAEDILTAVKPLLAEEGLLMIIQDDVVDVQDRVYIIATVKIFDAENGKEIATNRAFARESKEKKGMDSSQITGTASSYARKYALNGMFLIDDTKDADTDEYHKQTNQEKVPNLAVLKAKIKAAKLTDEELEKALTHHKVKDIKDLNDNQKIELELALTKKIKEINESEK